MSRHAAGSPSPLCGAAEGDAAALDALLATAAREAVERMDSEASIVYLFSPSEGQLGAAMICGTPPSIFMAPERMAPDAPYASARAWQAGNMVVLGEPWVSPHEARYAGLGPFPYTVASTPLIFADRRFGVLTVLRMPSQVGTLSDDLRERLRESGDRLARGLASLVEHGVSLALRPAPLLVPAVFGARSSSAVSRTGGWGLPGVPGSAPMTCMYHLSKLSDALNQALDTDDVTHAARMRMMTPFGAQVLVLSLVRDGRLWVVGHSGKSAATVKHLHGSRADGGTPEADTVLGRDPRFFRDRADLLAAYPDGLDVGQNAWAFLPLRASGRTTGVCSLGFGKEHAFESEEQAVLMFMADMVAPALQRTRLSESEHMLAVSLQKTLLPRILTDLPQVVTTARYLPAPATTGVGGDWYDVITLPEDKMGLIVGDVQGHGIESSAAMGQFRSTVLAYATEGHGPAAVLNRAGKCLAALGTELTATCCFACLDTAGGLLEVALAGHPAPLLRGPDADVQVLDAPPNVPLGMQSDTPYQAFDVTLEPGSLLLLYTDGLAGRRTADVVDIAQSMLSAGIRDAGGNLERLADRLTAAVPDPPARRDDVVLLLARYEGALPGTHGRVNRMMIQRHDLRGVRTARRFVRDSMHEWGRDATADDLELIVSEVVTNALIHADSEVDLRLREYPDHVRLEVRDSASTPPIPSSISVLEEESAQAEHGRGLVIVDGLARIWGTSPSGRGKTVWLELAT
ncbi:ATP-binding SpoIIE family protein phosphatase [Streptomyces gibsoniae]|uniref:SpoIIE family protein phosphatase n=1 Tax=Streptomyces gibsoniae TaxID=3075529 RepID=A0ABU2TML0_9ACTN|nr:SpoIIE family protein phosphatase [Streptomyces sp. DSM 41699]MDT0462182.1 SpoIIE family protein phosphatase [Streptomyces sp. DSM 41699]